MASGALPVEERNELLASMTDEVATLVLVHNLDQNLALATTGQTCRACEDLSGWRRAD